MNEISNDDFDQNASTQKLLEKPSKTKSLSTRRSQVEDSNNYPINH